MTQLQDVDTAVSVAFVVKIDDASIGAWSSCEGLGAEVVMEMREEGGNNAHVWQLPTRLKYSNIKLTRPLGADTSKIASWVSSVAQGYERKTAVIQAMRADGKVVAEWSVVDVLPVRWTGPSLNSDQPKVLTETLEIAHHGFTTR
ncbi:phage tail protein [Nocardioides sp. C4-1]|uniref:phage tail protein n=1 Tax=Nocardioides sp. C4-1 TaxID=3151851 RepID=UPI003262E917